MHRVQWVKAQSVTVVCKAMDEFWKKKKNGTGFILFVVTYYIHEVFGSILTYLRQNTFSLLSLSSETAD